MLQMPHIEHLIPIVRAAGDIVMTIYSTDFAVRSKDDSSPITEADERSEALIVKALHALIPGIPVVAEEMVAAGYMPEMGSRFWLIDPLDGTKEFISRNGEFTINVALIDDCQPVLGIVFAPALGKLFAGAIGSGAFIESGIGRRQIMCRRPPIEGITVVASRSHSDVAELDAFLTGSNVAAVKNVGSSLKLCLIASGEADLYPRLGVTMEWDIAAGHAVLVAAGGHLTTMDSLPMIYGKPGFKNPHFIASGQYWPGTPTVRFGR